MELSGRGRVSRSRRNAWNKENICPFEGRDMAAVSAEMGWTRSPLPPGFPRSPLQDITHILNPHIIWPDGEDPLSGQACKKLRKGRSAESSTFDEEKVNSLIWECLKPCVQVKLARRKETMGDDGDLIQGGEGNVCVEQRYEARPMVNVCEQDLYTQRVDGQKGTESEIGHVQGCLKEPENVKEELVSFEDMEQQKQNIDKVCNLNSKQQPKLTIDAFDHVDRKLNHTHSICTVSYGDAKLKQIDAVQHEDSMQHPVKDVEDVNVQVLVKDRNLKRPQHSTRSNNKSSILRFR